MTLPSSGQSVAQLAFSQATEMVGKKIRKITQPFDHCIIVETYGTSGVQNWLLSSHPQEPRLCETWRRFKSPALPPIFCLWLRKNINGGKIAAVRECHSQSLEIAITHGDSTYFLIFEINGISSNLLFLDGNKNLLVSLKHPNQIGRSLRPGAPYTLPTQWHISKEIPSEVQDVKNFDEKYWQLELEGDVQKQKSNYAKHFKSLTKKLARRLKNQENDLKKSEDSPKIRKWGELLKSQLHLIQSGDNQVTLTDYFDENLPEISIPLKREKTPAENLKLLFGKASKLEKAVPFIEQRILETLEDMEQLEEHQDHLKAIETAKELRAWEKKLKPYFRIREPSASKSKSNDKSKDKGEAMLTRISSDGIQIIVGKNKHQNVAVTFSIARGNEWWFHAQGVPGSHVVAKSSLPQLPPQTLKEAASLAAYYSKARGSGKVEVDYTQRKNVRKVKGGQPGEVLISQNKSILVDLATASVQSILDQS